MVMLNDLDPIACPEMASRAGHVRQQMSDRPLAARAFTRAEGKDDPEIAGWSWPY
jgi:xylulose-5-phosphate/fructose-6-phosphate phosphoketolase